VNTIYVDLITDWNGKRYDEVIARGNVGTSILTSDLTYGIMK